MTHSLHRPIFSQNKPSANHIYIQYGRLRTAAESELFTPVIKGYQRDTFVTGDYTHTNAAFPAILFRSTNIDEVAKSQKMLKSVIPAQSGIQELQVLTERLDTSLRDCVVIREVSF